VSTPYPAYAEAGTKKDGEWQQLNTNILQIENEYYSNIRPKRVTYSGERPIQALMSRGVQYVEVRCLDINPFLPMGIDLISARFMDAFVLFCALQDSPELGGGECSGATDNFLTVVKEGRKPGLQLRRNGMGISLQDWANDLLTQIGQVSAVLDESHGGALHVQALDAQRAKVADVSLTPSAQVLAALKANNETFTQFSFRQSQVHADYFRSKPLSAAESAAFEESVQQSLEDQAATEAEQSGDFDTFVAAYQASILALAV
jgi:glutamate--cysteine ligase